MKLFLGFILSVLCYTASATDYFSGQCYVGGPFNPYPAGQIGGTAGPSNCNMGEGQAVGVATFSDTETFYVGNWYESYGIWTYTSTTGVAVSGRTGVTPCSGRGCHGAPYTIIVDSATIDGVPLNPPTSGYTWTLSTNLAPGVHVFAVTGHASGALWYARWGAVAQGVLYTLEANPTPPCNDCGGD
jgi:hypothetical protein